MTDRVTGEGSVDSKWVIEFQLSKTEKSIADYALDKARMLCGRLEKATEKLKATEDECISIYVTTAATINSNPDEDVPLNPKFVIGSGFVSYLALLEAIRQRDEGNMFNVYGALSHAVAVAETLIGIKAEKSELMRSYAELRLRNDPRQLEKQFVHNCWKEWQDEPELYKSKAAFARSMLADPYVNNLTSTKKIEDWCRDWEKQPTVPAQ